MAKRENKEAIIDSGIDGIARMSSELRRYSDRPVLTHELCHFMEYVTSTLYTMNELRERDTKILEAAWATVVSSPENKKLFDHYYEEVKKRDRAGIKFDNRKDDTEGAERSV